MSFGLSGGSFVFCSEFLIGAKKAGYVEPSEPEESSKPEESKPESTSKPDETSKNDGKDENSNGGNEETRPDGSVSETDETLDNNAPESLSESNASENSENVENDENGVWLWVIVGAALLAVVAIVIAVIVKKKK
jgi:cobalamin biosynthesis Mg chelatase CobN